MELEADNPAKERGITAFKEYMKAGLDYGYADGYHVYYIGGGPSELCTIYNHQDPYFQSMYHDLYNFSKASLRPPKWSFGCDWALRKGVDRR